jgi:flagellar biosynthesis/type III secretory pathway protein FliH
MVIPVVLHHGEGRWSAAVRLEDLFDSDLITKAGAHDLVPRLSFVLDDLTDQTDEALEARQMGLEALLALWALRDARNRRRLEAAVEHWVPALARLLDGPNGRQALWTLFRYILAVADEAAAQSLAQALQARKPEAKEAIMTLAEKWFTEGRAEGKAEGRAEGKAEGKAESLRKLLTLKFGDVPQPVLHRLANASEAELDRFTERLLSAATIDEALV